MTTMNISLPEEMKLFIEKEMTEGHYSSVSEYVRALIRERQKQQAREKLDALLLESMQSGTKPLSDVDWEAMKNRVIRKSGKEN